MRLSATNKDAKMGAHHRRGYPGMTTALVQMFMRADVRFIAIVLLFAPLSCKKPNSLDSSQREHLLFAQYGLVVSWPPAVEVELIAIDKAITRGDYDSTVRGYMGLLARPEIISAANSNELRGYIYLSLAEESLANPRNRDVLACVSFLHLAWNNGTEQIREAAAKLLVAVYESEERDDLANLWR